jgi:hypothetical protein
MSSSDKKIDHLKQDPILAGQDYAVVSFVNPKDHVLGKQLHYINNFLVNDVNKSITAQAMQMIRKLQVDMRKKIEDVLDKLKYSLDEEDKNLSRILEKRYREMLLDEDEYVEECRRRYEMDSEELLDKYKIFLSGERTRLNREYDEANDGATSLRGFKIRGAYDRYEEASARAKYVRDTVEPAVHAFVVQVGTWFPVDMEADEVQDQDYMLPQLNELMGKYHEGAHARNLHYQERKQEMAEEASAPDRKTAQKNRLQEKLRQKRNKKMKDEQAEFLKLAGDKASDVNAVDAKKKRRRKKRPKETGEEGGIFTQIAAAGRKDEKDEKDKKDSAPIV